VRLEYNKFIQHNRLQYNKCIQHDTRTLSCTHLKKREDKKGDHERSHLLVEGDEPWTAHRRCGFRMSSASNYNTRTLSCTHLGKKKVINRAPMLVEGDVPWPTDRRCGLRIISLSNITGFSIISLSDITPELCPVRACFKFNLYEERVRGSDRTSLWKAMSLGQLIEGAALE